MNGVAKSLEELKFRFCATNVLLNSSKSISEGFDVGRDTMSEETSQKTKC